MILTSKTSSRVMSPRAHLPSVSAFRHLQLSSPSTQTRQGGPINRSIYLKNEYTNDGYGYVEVKLTNVDKVFVIDDDQIDLVQECMSWSLSANGHVRGWIDGKVVSLHRLLMQDELKASSLNKPCIDHIDRNPLNNGKYNLRVASLSTNSRSKKVIGKSRFPGVYFNKNANKWNSRIYLDGKKKHLGYYLDEMDAARAYRTAFRLQDHVSDYEVWDELDKKQNTIEMYFKDPNPN